MTITELLDEIHLGQHDDDGEKLIADYVAEKNSQLQKELDEAHRNIIYFRDQQADECDRRAKDQLECADNQEEIDRLKSQLATAKADSMREAAQICRREWARFGWTFTAADCSHSILSAIQQETKPVNQEFNCPPVCPKCHKCHHGECAPLDPPAWNPDRPGLLLTNQLPQEKGCEWKWQPVEEGHTLYGYKSSCGKVYSCIDTTNPNCPHCGKRLEAK